ncbi:MAG: DUF342 domain-containing protein [Chitinivibrionales bacterium]|nr:DUF342 domain-containing protein [Chitinivibrionales bacterium]
MNLISATYSPDGLKAFLFVSEELCDDYPLVEELKNCCTEKGIVFGIDEKVLKAMTVKRVCNKRIEVARGVPPESGKDARCELLFEFSSAGKPRELEDGRVDHKDLQNIVNVKKDAPLARRIPPVPGKSGTSVLGKEIPPPPSKDVVLKGGKGTVISQDDGNLLVAAIDGGVSVLRGGTIEVRNEKVIPSNVDYSTGNVKFAGNLIIRGTVRAGFSAEAQGDITVERNVEDAVVSCRGDMEIMGGAVGSNKGILKSGSMVKARHIEHFVVESGGDIVVAEDAIHSKLSAENTITAKSLVGGSIFAGVGIDVSTIGASSETKTTVRIGGAGELIKQKYTLLRHLAKLSERTGLAAELMYKVVNESMDENGTLPRAAIERLNTLKNKKKECKIKCNTLQEQICNLDSRIEAFPRPYIKSRKIFPGTVIQFGDYEKIIKKERTNVYVTVEEDTIVFN